MSSYIRPLASVALLFLITIAGANPESAQVKVNPGSSSTAAQTESEATAPADSSVVDWVRQHAIRLATVEAGHGFADMQPLNKIIGDARIVALGEATHGTREFFQLKHRMIEYLASQKGFTIFSIEANMPEAYRLNDFVLNGNGDPKQLLKGMYFWTWNTEEVLDMILWMREFNRSGKGRIEFTGFDMQTPEVAMEIVRTFVQQHDPSYLDTVSRAYRDVEHAQKPQGSQQAFGVGTATFPVKAAAGKHIRYSGYIRADAITQGFAGLWWRVDGSPGQMLAFDNMQNRPVTGTTPWTRYEIALDVPANATNINFGVLHPGNGTAWFDSLQIEVDGQPYADTSTFDLDFEADSPRGFYTGGQGYEVALDKTSAHTGKQSLRSRRLSIEPPPAETPVDIKPVAESCKQILDHLESGRSALVQASNTKDVDWAIQSARVVLQSLQMKTGEKTRDESMAKNVKWIADHNPGAEIVLWAHNGHVASQASWTSSPMGGYLRKWFGRQFMNFGFAFNQGSFQAVEPGKNLHDFTVGPAPEGSLDRTLAAAGISAFALDLRQLPRQGPVRQWFDQPHSSRSIGAMYSDATAASYFANEKAQDEFDAILFVEKTTAAHPNH